VSAARLVFVDESGANTQMTRRYGRSPVGQRLACPVPHGHYQTTTMIAGVRLEGPQAPWLFGGAMDGALFLAWVKQGLVRCLQPGDVVVMDNLATHKVAGVREAIEGAGARLEYLPPYSPDFNPIEPLWSKVKQGLRSRGPRNARQLHLAAGSAFAAVTPPTVKGSFCTPDTLYDLWNRDMHSSQVTTICCGQNPGRRLKNGSGRVPTPPPVPPVGKTAAPEICSSAG